MPPRAVLHIAQLFGGGVDRHVRDVMRSVPRPQLLWHVGAGAEVLELGPGRHRVLDSSRVDANAAEVAALARAHGIGVVHAHTLTAPAQARARASRLPYVVTLHDVLFLNADAFEHGAEFGVKRETLAANEPFLRAASAVLAPSAYVADLARANVPGLRVQVLPNGSVTPPSPPVAARDEFLARRPRHTVAVIGAIGPHKGSDFLDALARDIEGSDIAIVVIGYADRQLTPGWRHPGTYFVHGAYGDEDVRGLLSAYGAELALFPNRVPESFSYALSDAWACGLPVLAAPHGALGERIRAHGGGWLLEDGFTAASVAVQLRELFAGRSSEWARVKSQLAQPDPDRVPSLEQMARSLDALYQRFSVPEDARTDPNAPAMERLLATNVDGSLFRVELARLADELRQCSDANAELRGAIEEARRFEADSRGWMEKLQRDVAALTADVEREVAQRRAFAEENEQLGVYRRALEGLPSPIRRLLLKRARNARS